MTPNGSVIAKSRQEAATKKNVPFESVYTVNFRGVPARCAQYYK